MIGLLSIPDCQHGPGVADVLIAPIGGRGAQTIEAADIGATWEVKQTGQLAADLPLDVAIRQFGDVRDLQGRWLSWSGHPAGDWSGVITRVAPNRASGVVTLTCSDFCYALDKRLLPISQRKVTGKPGAVAAVLLNLAQRTEALWLTDIVCAEEGDDYSVELQGQGLLQQLRQMADDTDQEFTIDADRVFRWGVRLGSDLTSSVQLAEGMEIAAHTPDFDIAGVVNELTVSPAVERYRLSRARTVIDDASVDAIGPQQGQLTTSDGVRPSVIRTIGAREVARSAALGATVSFDVVNVNNAFAAFRFGDTIRVVLASLDFAEDVRIIQTGIVLSEGVVRVVGEVSA